MKKLVVFMALLLICSSTAVLAEDENIIEVGNFYQLGTQYLKSDQYTKAITEFKKALRENPADNSSRIQITNAYLARAAYYNNQVKDYKNTANDLRSALFYMKYYDVTPVDATTMNNIHLTEGNLDNTLFALNADKSTKGRFNEGKSLRAQGEFAAAVTEFQNAQSDPKYRKESLIALGEIYYIMNLNEQAATYLERALYDDPANSDAHLKLARVYERMGNPDKAAKEYSYALTKSSENQEILLSLENIWKQKVAACPEDAESHANLGAIYQKRGNPEAAFKEYTEAERLNPSNATTRLNLGTLFQQQKQYETAIEAYDSILRLYPNYTQAYYYKAQCLKALGYRDAAIQNYKLAVSLEPDNKVMQNELFELYKKDMTPEETLKYMYEQVQKAPSDPDAVYNYAYELHKNKRLDDAIAYYNQALKLDPNNPDTYVNLAIVYKQKSNYEKAKQLLTDAKGLFPENNEVKKQLSALESEITSTLYSNASSMFNQKKYKEALALYNKIQPATVESLVGAGASYQALNSNKSAIECYKKAFAMDSHNADTAYYLALAYSNDNNTEEAKAYAQKALALVPAHKDAQELKIYLEQSEAADMLTQAIDFYEKKEYDKAFPLLTKVLSINPKEANAHYYCGLIYDEQKKYWPAIESYKKALEVDNQMNIAYYSIAVDYDYLAKYKEAVTYFKKYTASTNEVNDYTKYAKKRLTELKKYDTPAK